MIKKSLFFVGLCITLHSSAADFTKLTLSGFNADCIYQSGENMGNHTSLDGGNWIYYAKSHRAEGGLDQEFTSKRGVPYKLANFSGNNVLLLHENGKGADLVFQNQTKATELFVLGMQGGGYQKVKVRVQYTDNTETYQEIEFSDWYNDEAGSAIYGLGRMDRTNGGFDGSNFGLYEKIILVDGNKTLKKMWCEAGNNGYASIFAVTASTGYSASGNNPLFLISDSHLDSQWDWDVNTTIAGCIKSTLYDNLERLDKYDKFRFNFEGAQKYQWMKEYYPDKYERLKEYVAQGRWNPAGGGWDANEVMISSAESLLRNLLYGQTFYKHEFNKKGGLDIMLPDCFGFPATLPTIAAHCGSIGFHSQKLSWGSSYDYPDFGKWRGIDGSEIYCILRPGGYDTRHKENLAYSGLYFDKIDANDQKLGLRATFQYTGTGGDRGGALSDEEVYWLQESVNTTDGRVTVKLATPTEAFEYMQSHDNGQYKVVDHELPLSTHGVGCYTSQTWMKYWNRRNELTADAAERTSVAADWLGAKAYPYQALTDAWKRVIWHQFHDDVTGTCIPRAYGYSKNDEVVSLMDFRTARDGAVAAVAENLDTRVGNMPVVVYNPLSIEREDIVECHIASDRVWQSLRVTDSEGNEVPSQITKYADGEQYFIFAAKVPSMGYATFNCQKNGTSTYNPAGFSISGNTMENSKYRVTIDQGTGDIKSLYDKTLNQELFSGNLRLALIECRSTTWPSWEIPWSETRKQSDYVGDSPQISIVEDGPLRKSFRIVRKRQGSTFVQYVRLTSAGSNERVDVENEFDWQSRGRMLKLEANLNGKNKEATYDTSLGYLTRGVSTERYYEFCGHQWADQTSADGRYGLSILNDCKYGWDKPDEGKLRMTVVYTPIVGDNRRYQGNQDLGYNQFRFSLFSHAGKVGEQTRWQSDRLNQPLVGYVTTAHDGALGKKFSFAQVNSDKVSVRTLKRAEDSNVYIIRFHELVGERQQNVTVTFPTNIVSATEVNGLEEKLEGVSGAAFSDKTLTFDIGRFSVKTFAIELQPTGIAKRDANLTTSTVNLEYNADLYSRNDRREDGENTWLFPGELIGKQISHEGVTFNMGSSDNGQNNVVRCQGQNITLPGIASPTADTKTIHLLAFSTKPLGTKVEFDANGQKEEVEVGYYRGNIADADGYFGTSAIRKENVAFIGTHSHTPWDKWEIAYDYLYIYHYKIQVPQNCNSLRLPNQDQTFIAAISLEDGPAHPFTSLQEDAYLFPSAQDVAIDARPRDLWLKPVRVTASAWTNGDEAPEYAADGNSFTKWCCTDNTKWIEYEFDEEVEVRQWELLSGAFEQNNEWNDNQSYITAAAKLQYLDASGQYRDVDSFWDNKENHITRSIQTATSKKFRLVIDKPEQGDGGAARIYQFNLYGVYHSTTTRLEAVLPTVKDGTQPIYDLSGRAVGTAEVHKGIANLPQLPAGIYVISGKKVRVNK